MKYNLIHSFIHEVLKSINELNFYRKIQKKTYIKHLHPLHCKDEVSKQVPKSPPTR